MPTGVRGGAGGECQWIHHHPDPSLQPTILLPSQDNQPTNQPTFLLPSQDKQDNITSQACQDEVFYYELMEVTDFRNDVILAEACRNDVEAYCKDTEPGVLFEHLSRSHAPVEEPCPPHL